MFSGEVLDFGNEFEFSLKRSRGFYLEKSFGLKLNDFLRKDSLETNTI